MSALAPSAPPPLAPSGAPPPPTVCGGCHVPLPAPEARFKCWACLKFGTRASRTYCGACAPRARCVPDCRKPHRLCARHTLPPARGYERETWLDEHGYEAEDEPTCVNCTGDPRERSGCSVCDSTGHQYYGKGGGHTPIYHGVIEGVGEGY